MTAAITITYNRLELTKKTIESFSGVDYHLFVDNGSTDGTREFLKGYNHILLEKNYGIAYAFKEGVYSLKDFDYIIKLDNDVEVVTPDIVSKMLEFYRLNGDKYVCSPIDLNLDKAYAPPVLGEGNLVGFDVRFTSHTGGAFQMIPYNICMNLCREFHHLKCGDYMIGKYFRKQGYKPTYLTNLEMRHIGINQSCNNYIL